MPESNNETNRMTMLIIVLACAVIVTSIICICLLRFV
jgi:hypothetical protein